MAEVEVDGTIRGKEVSGDAIGTVSVAVIRVIRKLILNEDINEQTAAHCER